MPSLSVVLLTYTEEQNLPGCLDSLAPLGCECFIVDSGSTDATLEIAAAHGAIAVHHPFETHSAQWQWAVGNLPIRTEWILGLDSDQSLTPELAAELSAMFAGDAAPACLDDYDGFYINRRNIYRGRWIRHGGCYPKYLLKLFRRSRVILDPSNDLLDHHFYVKGRTGKLKHDLIEENKKEHKISFWVSKHIRYAELVAREEYVSRGNQSTRPVAVKWFGGTPDERIEAMKHTWRRFPAYVRPLCYFVFRYFLQLGFLDGKQGFIFHFMQAYWFRLLVDINLDELRSAPTPPRTIPKEPHCAEGKPGGTQSW